MKTIGNNIRGVHLTIKINKTLFKLESKALSDPFLRKSMISPHLWTKCRSTDLEIYVYITENHFRENRLKSILIQKVDPWPPILTEIVDFQSNSGPTSTSTGPKGKCRGIFKRSESSTWLLLISSEATRLCFNRVKGNFGSFR